MQHTRASGLRRQRRTSRFMDLKGGLGCSSWGRGAPLPDAAPGHWGPPSGLQTVFHLPHDGWCREGSEGASPKHRNKTMEEHLLQVIDSSIHFRYTQVWETGHAPYRERRKRQGFKNKDRHNVFNFLKQLDPMLQEARDWVVKTRKELTALSLIKTAHDRVPTVMLGGMLWKLGENKQKMPKLGLGKLYFREIFSLKRK